MAAAMALEKVLGKQARQTDPEMKQYIISLLEDEDNDDSDALIEQLRELLSDVAPAFGALDAETQTNTLLALCEEARARGDDGAAHLRTGVNGASTSRSGGAADKPAAEDDDDGASALVASFRQQLEIAASDEQGGAASGSGRVRLTGSSSSGGGGGSSDGGGVDCRELADPAALAALRELCAQQPGACDDDFLAHVLVERHNGDADAAAAWLMDQGSGSGGSEGCSGGDGGSGSGGGIGAAAAAWRRRRDEAREAAAREAAERARGKAAVIARFDLQVVKDGPSDPRKERVEAWSVSGSKKQQKEAAAQGMVRYRDGVKVASNGAKFIIEKPPEFDGGSRGKVYTKGKRGKGFV